MALPLNSWILPEGVLNPEYQQFEMMLFSTQTITKYIIVALIISEAAFWWKTLTWLRPADVDDTPVLSTFTSRPFVDAIVIMALIYGAFLLLRNIIIVPNFPQLF